MCRVCPEGAECDCREMPVLAEHKESKKAAGKCDAREMCPLPLEMCRRRGAWNPGVRTGSGEAAAPWESHFSDLSYSSLFCHQSVQMSGVHIGCLWAGNKTETGNQGVLWCCWWNWILTGFDLQEKLARTPIVPWLLCSPTVVTCLMRDTS